MSGALVALPTFLRFGKFLRSLPWPVWAALAVVILMWASYIHGKHVERRAQEAADAIIQQQVIATARKDRQDTEEQNRADQQTISQLNAHVAELEANPPSHPAPRLAGLCRPSSGNVPAAQGNAGEPQASPAAGRRVPDAADTGGDLLALRADLLEFARQCQAVRIGALAGQAQWPTH